MQRSETQVSVQKLPTDCYTNTASIMAFGYNPFIAEWSPYHGAAYAVVEACAKVVAAGADYSHIRVAFGMALYHFWHDTPASSAIRSAILSGGSTDINAGATGALCGAFQGMESIPDSWREILYNGFEQPHADLANRAIVSIERILGRKTQPAVHIMRESGVARRIRRSMAECVEYAQSA